MCYSSTTGDVIIVKRSVYKILIINISGYTFNLYSACCQHYGTFIWRLILMTGELGRQKCWLLCWNVRYIVNNNHLGLTQNVKWFYYVHQFAFIAIKANYMFVLIFNFLQYVPHQIRCWLMFRLSQLIFKEITALVLYVWSLYRLDKVIWACSPWIRPRLLICIQ